MFEIFRQRDASIRDFVCVSVVSQFLSFELATSREVVQRCYTIYVVTSNAGAWLSNATLRFFSLAEQCHTQEFLI